MTDLLTAALLKRADEQTRDVREDVTRVECACGCGVWFYARRGQTGRPRAYVNPDHVELARLRRRVASMQRRLGL